GAARAEPFAYCARIPADPRYAVTAVNAGSSLVQVKLAGAIGAAGGAQSTSAAVSATDVQNGFPAGPAGFNVSLNGDAPGTGGIAQPTPPPGLDKIGRPNPAAGR